MHALHAVEVREFLHDKDIRIRGSVRWQDKKPWGGLQHGRLGILTVDAQELQRLVLCDCPGEL